MTYPVRPPDPRTYTAHRDEVLRHYWDFTDALPSGVTISSATVAWGERTVVGTVTDRTAQFGSPAVEVAPTAVPSSGGGTQGGAGWIAFTPAMHTDLPDGTYELLVRVTLSSTEVVTQAQTWTVSDWGDPDAS